MSGSSAPVSMLGGGGTSSFVQTLPGEAARRSGPSEPPAPSAVAIHIEATSFGQPWQVGRL